jgi:hypothetical protein
MGAIGLDEPRGGGTDEGARGGGTADEAVSGILILSPLLAAAAIVEAGATMAGKGGGALPEESCWEIR